MGALVPLGNILKAARTFFPVGGNGIGPIGVSVLFVNLQCIFHGGRNFNPKLEVSLEVSGDALSNEGYNPVAFLQHMWNPPVKGWFVVNLQKFCVFRSFNGV